MKVLVTGAAGFIGSNVVNEIIKRKIPVVGVDCFVESYSLELKRQNIVPMQESPIAEFIEGNINDASLFSALESKEITHIIHLAARAGVRESSIVPKEYLETNILGTLNVLEFAKKIGAKKVILASTSSAYGKNTPPFKEDMNISTPLSIYAASKVAAENLCYAFHNIYKLPIVILRFFTVYGPGGRPDMAVYKFSKLISEGKEIEVYGDGGAKRDYTFVLDIVQGILLAMESEIDYAVFNLGHNESKSVDELVSIIEKNLGKKAIIKNSPKRDEDPDVTLADISKAKKILRYSPKINLEEGVKKFIEWFNKTQINE